MTQRDVTLNDLIKMDEGKHRDSFCFSLLRNHYLLPRAEFQVTRVIHWLIIGKTISNQCLQVDNKNGRIDLLIPGSRQLIVTEWKFFRINCLDVRGPDNTIPDVFNKAATLCDYELSEILELKFVAGDRYHQGTIKQWVVTNAGQLKDYIKSHEVTQQVLNEELEMRAHMVIIVGSRHILLWDMDKDGNLANEPQLVE
jgi:hypothetical protein